MCDRCEMHERQNLSNKSQTSGLMHCSNRLWDRTFPIGRRSSGRCTTTQHISQLHSTEHSCTWLPAVTGNWSVERVAGRRRNGHG